MKQISPYCDRKKFSDTQGFILMDILIGLFIFGLGFAVMWGLTSSAVLAGSKAANYYEAVNLAGSTMDELIMNLNENSDHRFTYLSGEISGKAGKFAKNIKARRESDNLLLLSVEILWKEKGEEREYLLESLYYFYE